MTSTTAGQDSLYTQCKAQAVLNCVYLDVANQAISFQFDNADYYEKLVYFRLYPKYTYYELKGDSTTQDYESYAIASDTAVVQPSTDFYVSTTLDLCDEAVVSQAFVQFTAISEYIDYEIGVTGEQTLNYVVNNDPSTACFSGAVQSSEYFLRLAAQDSNGDYLYVDDADQIQGTSYYYVMTDYTLYQSCVAEAAYTCCYHDEANKQIKYQLDGDELGGMNLYFRVYPQYLYVEMKGNTEILEYQSYESDTQNSVPFSNYYVVVAETGIFCTEATVAATVVTFSKATESFEIGSGSAQAVSYRISNGPEVNCESQMLVSSKYNLRLAIEDTSSGTAVRTYKGSQDQIDDTNFFYVMTSYQDFIDCTQSSSDHNCVYNDEAGTNIQYQFSNGEYYGKSVFFVIYPEYEYYETDGDTAILTYDYYNEEDEDQALFSRDYYVTTTIPCMDAQFVSAVIDYDTYENYQIVTYNSVTWADPAGIIIEMNTNYLAYDTATGQSDVTLELIWAVDTDSCSGYPLSTYSDQTDSTFISLMQNGFFQSAFQSSDERVSGIKVNPVTVASIYEMDALLIDVIFRFGHIYQMDKLDDQYRDSQPEATYYFKLTVGACVPYSTIFTWLNGDKVLDLEVDQLGIFAYRNQAVTQQLITMSIVPFCDDSQNNFSFTTLHGISYQTVQNAQDGTVSIYVNLFKPVDDSAPDTVQQVDMLYQNGAYSKLLSFQVTYIGCAFSEINPQQIDAVTANIGNPAYLAYTNFTDTWSLSHGNKDGHTYCGLRKININTVAFPFLSIDEYQNVTVHASQEYLGTYLVPYFVTLQSYPEVAPVTGIVQITIEQELDKSICLFSNDEQGTYFLHEYYLTYYLDNGQADIDISQFFNLNEKCAENIAFAYVLTYYPTAITFEYPELQVYIDTGDLDPMPTDELVYVLMEISNSTHSAFYITVVYLTITELPVEVETVVVDQTDSQTDQQDAEIIADDDSFTLLEEWPDEPEIIYCIGTETANRWSYQLPERSEKHNIVNHWNIVMQDMFNWDSKNLELTLKSQITKDPPASGTYIGTFTVINPHHNYQEIYQVAFTYECDIELTEEDLTPPYPIVQTVTSVGTILIKWNKEMKLPDADHSMVIANGKLGQPLDKDQFNRLLQVIGESESVQISFDQGSNTEVIDPSLVGSFSWQMEWVSNTETEISLEFDHPEYVSALVGEKDSVQVQIKDPSLFKSSKDIAMPSDMVFTIPLPRQLSENDITVNVKSAATAGTVAIGTTLVFSFILKAILNQILGLVDSISIITHMFLLSLNYPVNVQTFFGQIFPMIAFDLIPFDVINNGIFRFNEVETDEPLTEQFESVGYESSLIILALGDIYYLMALSPVIVLILYLLRWSSQSCCYADVRCFRWFKQYIQFQIEGYFWNGTIQFIYSGYLIMALCIMIGLSNLHFGGDFLWQENFCSITTLLLTVLVVSFPFIIFAVYFCKIKASTTLPDLNDLMTIDQLKKLYGTINVQEINKNAYTVSKHQAFLDKYGSLVEGMNIEKHGKLIVILFPVFNMLRKLLLALAIVIFIPYPHFAVMTFNFTSLFMIMLEVYVMPLKDRNAQYVSIFNELTTMVINYHLFCMTNFTDVGVRSYVGNSIIYTTCANIAINILIITVPIIQDGWKKLRKWNMLRKHKQKQQKKEQAKVQVVPQVDKSLEQRASIATINTVVTVADGGATEMGTVNNYTQNNYDDETKVHHNKRRKIVQPPGQVNVSIEVGEEKLQDFNTSLEMQEVAQQEQNQPPQKQLTNIQIGMNNLRRKTRQKKLETHGRVLKALPSIEESKEENEQEQSQPKNDDSQVFMQSFGSHQMPKFNILKPKYARGKSVTFEDSVKQE